MNEQINWTNVKVKAIQQVHRVFRLFTLSSSMCATFDFFFFILHKNRGSLSLIYSRADMKRTFWLYSKRKTSRKCRRIRSRRLRGGFPRLLPALLRQTMDEVFSGFLIFYLWNETSCMYFAFFFFLQAGFSKRSSLVL